MSIEIIEDAMGSVCRKTVKICAATAATATDNIATTFGGEGTKYSNAIQPMPTIHRAVANHRIRYRRPRVSTISAPPELVRARPRFDHDPWKSGPKQSLCSTPKVTWI
jgi:hypothetical protein